MKKSTVLCVLWLCMVSVIASENSEKREKNNLSLNKRASLIIGIPIDASEIRKEKTEWFSGIAELYLHFRIGASNNLDIIPSESIHKAIQKQKKAMKRDDFDYSSVVQEFGVTHILQHTFEISRDGKSVHYYAEIASTKGSKRFDSFERDFELINFARMMDSCVFWFSHAAGIDINQEKLSRFFNLTTVTQDTKEMKTMGDIVVRRYVSTKQEVMTSTEALCAMVERDPRNLLAQYIASRLYEASGSFEKAIEQVKGLLMILPNYASLYADVCRNYRYCKKYKEALSYASNAEKKGIVTRVLILEGARALEAMGKYTKASKAYSILLKADDTEPHALLYFARLHNRKGNAEKAITFADRILLSNANNGEGYLEKGKALFHLKRNTQAIEALKKSAGLVKNTSVPTQLIGDIHVQSKDYEKAALFFEAALKSDTRDFPLLLKTVETWEKAQKPDRALKVLQNAENVFPDSLIVQKFLGLLYYQVDDRTNAIFHLERFLEKSKKEDAEVLITLGDLYTHKGDYDKAFYMYNHAMPLLADKTKGTISLALLYLKKGDTGAAISYLKEIVKEKPEYPEAFRYLGDAWYKANNYTIALKEYKKARFLDNRNAYIQSRIASIYFMQQEYNAAVREYSELIVLTPKDANPYFYLAIAYLHLKKETLAEEYITKGLALGKPDSEILYQLGLGYAHVQNRKKSIVYYQECIAHDPKHENALNKIAEAFQAEGNKKGAADTYLKLYELNPGTYHPCLAKAGFLYEQEHDTAKAYTIFSTFVKNNYKNSLCTIHLARIEHSKENYETVITLLEKIPAADLSEKDDMLILANAYFIIGKPQKAIPWLRTIVSRNNKHKEALVMLAISYEKTGDFTNAIKNYKKVFDIVTEEERARYSYKIAILYEKSNRLDEAIEAYRENIDQFPEYLSNYHQLAKLYSKSRNWGAVREILEKSVKLSNAKPFYWKKLAEVCLKQNDKAGASKSYKKYLEINPKDDDAWLQLGDLYFDRGVFSKALVYYKKANNLKPDNFAILFKSGLAFYNMENTTMAIKLFSQASAQDSTHTEVLNYLALCYRRENNSEKVIQTLYRLARLEPDNYSVKVELGCALLGQGKKEEAINHLETACKMNPKDPEIHIILSGMYASLNNENARYSHLKKALNENPDNVDVQCLMGEFYLEQKEYTTALKHIKKALALDADHAETQYAYSAYLFAQKEIDKAITYIKQAVSTDAYNPRYLVMYARINHAIGKKNIALKTIEDALTIDSTGAEVLSCAGFLYKEAGRIEKAKRFLLKAISLSDKCAECFASLGDIYFEETQCAKAAGFFRRALTISGYDEDIMMKLGRALVLSYQNEAAKEIFENVFNKNPSHHEAFYRLAHTYLLWKNVKKVQALLAQRTSDKKTVWDHLVQGELLEFQGNIEAALISYSVALRLQPEMVEAFAGMGRIDLQRGDYNNAIVNFSKALVKDPYNPYLLLDLGKAYEGIGQFSSAFNIYSDVVDKYSQIPETYTLIAGIRSREKKHTRAVEIVQKGLKHNPESAQLYVVLGSEYTLLSEYENAIEAYKNAVKYGDNKYLDAYLNIANIYYNYLKNEKEAKRYLRKYLKNGGKKEQLEKYNLARFGS